MNCQNFRTQNLHELCLLKTFIKGKQDLFERKKFNGEKNRFYFKETGFILEGKVKNRIYSKKQDLFCLLKLKKVENLFF